MILRANIRGNGAQLSEYLLSMNENSRIEILEVDGREYADQEYLHQILMSMELNSELTKSDKAFFNVQINPAYGEDKAMTLQDWQTAADVLAIEAGYEDQRRIIVLHTKKGRTHAHVVYERYNHETGIMIDNKHSRLKVDAARPKIEQALNHKPTPKRNRQRPELKAAVTAIWNKTKTGAAFLKEVRKAGYMVAEGTANRPFMIVDENGRSFDLVRQLQGVRTKEVRARLRNERLIPEKMAIDLMREQGAASSGKREKQRIDHKPTAQATAKSFAENRGDAIKQTPDNPPNPKFTEFAQELTTAKQATTADHVQIDTNGEEQRKQEIAEQFADNREAIKADVSEPDNKRQKIIAQQKAIRERNRLKKRLR